MLAMLELHAHVRARGAVRTGLIGDQDTRSAGLFAEELAKQAFGGASVAATLNQSIEDKAVLIDGAPKPVLFVICDHEASGAGESHPRALSEPDVTLSRHPAPIVRPRPWIKLQ